MPSALFYDDVNSDALGSRVLDLILGLAKVKLIYLWFLGLFANWLLSLIIVKLLNFY